MCQAWGKCLHDLQHLSPTSCLDWFSYSSHFPHWDAEAQRSQMRIGRQWDSHSGLQLRAYAFVWNTSRSTASAKLPPCSSLCPQAHSSLLGTAAQSCRQVHICRLTHPDSPSSSQSHIASFPLAGPLCSAAQVNISSWVPCTQDLLDQNLLSISPPNPPQINPPTA